MFKTTKYSPDDILACYRSRKVYLQDFDFGPLYTDEPFLAAVVDLERHPDLKARIKTGSNRKKLTEGINREAFEKSLQNANAEKSFFSKLKHNTMLFEDRSDISSDYESSYSSEYEEPEPKESEKEIEEPESEDPEEKKKQEELKAVAAELFNPNRTKPFEPPKPYPDEIVNGQYLNVRVAKVQKYVPTQLKQNNIEQFIENNNSRITVKTFRLGTQDAKDFMLKSSNNKKPPPPPEKPKLKLKEPEVPQKPSLMPDFIPTRLVDSTKSMAPSKRIIANDPFEGITIPKRTAHAPISIFMPKKNLPPSEMRKHLDSISEIGAVEDNTAYDQINNAENIYDEENENNEINNAEEQMNNPPEPKKKIVKMKKVIKVKKYIVGNQIVDMKQEVLSSIPANMAPTKILNKTELEKRRKEQLAELQKLYAQSQQQQQEQQVNNIQIDSTNTAEEVLISHKKKVTKRRRKKSPIVNNPPPEIITESSWETDYNVGPSVGISSYTDQELENINVDDIDFELPLHAAVQERQEKLMEEQKKQAILKADGVEKVFSSDVGDISLEFAPRKAKHDAYMGIEIKPTDKQWKAVKRPKGFKQIKLKGPTFETLEERKRELLDSIVYPDEYLPEETDSEEIAQVKKRIRKKIRKAREAELLGDPNDPYSDYRGKTLLLKDEEDFKSVGRSKEVDHKQKIRKRTAYPYGYGEPGYVFEEEEEVVLSYSNIPKYNQKNAVSFDKLMEEEKNSSEQGPMRIIMSSSSPLLDELQFGTFNRSKKSIKIAPQEPAWETVHRDAWAAEPEKPKIQTELQKKKNESFKVQPKRADYKQRMEEAEKDRPVSSEFERLLAEEEAKAQKEKEKDKKPVQKIRTNTEVTEFERILKNETSAVPIIKPRQKTVWDTIQVTPDMIVRPIGTTEILPGGKTWGIQPSFQPKPTMWATLQQGQQTKTEKEDDDFYGQPRKSFFEELYEEELKKKEEARAARRNRTTFGPMKTSNFENLMKEEERKEKEGQGQNIVVDLDEDGAAVPQKRVKNDEMFWGVEDIIDEEILGEKVPQEPIRASSKPALEAEVPRARSKSARVSRHLKSVMMRAPEYSEEPIEPVKPKKISYFWDDTTQSTEENKQQKPTTPTTTTWAAVDIDGSTASLESDVTGHLKRKLPPAQDFESIEIAERMRKESPTSAKRRARSAGHVKFTGEISFAPKASTTSYEAPSVDVQKTQEEEEEKAEQAPEANSTESPWGMGAFEDDSEFLYLGQQYIPKSKPVPTDFVVKPRAPKADNVAPPIFHPVESKPLEPATYHSDSSFGLKSESTPEVPSKLVSEWTEDIFDEDDDFVLVGQPSTSKETEQKKPTRSASPASSMSEILAEAEQEKKPKKTLADLQSLEFHPKESKKHEPVPVTDEIAQAVSHPEIVETTEEIQPEQNAGSQWAEDAFNEDDDFVFVGQQYIEKKPESPPKQENTQFEELMEEAKVEKETAKKQKLADLQSLEFHPKESKKFEPAQVTDEIAAASTNIDATIEPSNEVEEEAAPSIPENEWTEDAFGEDTDFVFVGQRYESKQPEKKKPARSASPARDIKEIMADAESEKEAIRKQKQANLESLEFHPKESKKIEPVQVTDEIAQAISNPDVNETPEETFEEPTVEATNEWAEDAFDEDADFVYYGQKYEAKKPEPEQEQQTVENLGKSEFEELLEKEEISQKISEEERKQKLAELQSPEFRPKESRKIEPVQVTEEIANPPNPPAQEIQEEIFPETEETTTVVTNEWAEDAFDEDTDFVYAGRKYESKKPEQEQQQQIPGKSEFDELLAEEEVAMQSAQKIIQEEKKKKLAEIQSPEFRPKESKKIEPVQVTDEVAQAVQNQPEEVQEAEESAPETNETANEWAEDAFTEDTDFEYVGQQYVAKNSQEVNEEEEEQIPEKSQFEELIEDEQSAQKATMEEKKQILAKVQSDFHPKESKWSFEAPEATEEILEASTNRDVVVQEDFDQTTFSDWGDDFAEDYDFDYFGQRYISPYVEEPQPEEEPVTSKTEQKPRAEKRADIEQPEFHPKESMKIEQAEVQETHEQFEQPAEEEEEAIPEATEPSNAWEEGAFAEDDDFAYVGQQYISKKSEPVQQAPGKSEFDELLAEEEKVSKPVQIPSQPEKKQTVPVQSPEFHPKESKKIEPAQFAKSLTDETVDEPIVKEETIPEESQQNQWAENAYDEDDLMFYGRKYEPKPETKPARSDSPSNFQGKALFETLLAEEEAAAKAQKASQEVKKSVEVKTPIHKPIDVKGVKESKKVEPVQEVVKKPIVKEQVYEEEEDYMKGTGKAKIPIDISKIVQSPYDLGTKMKKIKKDLFPPGFEPGVLASLEAPEVPPGFEHISKPAETKEEPVEVKAEPVVAEEEPFVEEEEQPIPQKFIIKYEKIIDNMAAKKRSSSPPSIIPERKSQVESVINTPGFIEDLAKKVQTKKIKKTIVKKHKVHKKPLNTKDIDDFIADDDHEDEMNSMIKQITTKVDVPNIDINMKEQLPHAQVPEPQPVKGLPENWEILVSSDQSSTYMSDSDFDLPEDLWGDGNFIMRKSSSEGSMSDGSAEASEELPLSLMDPSESALRKKDLEEAARDKIKIIEDEQEQADYEQDWNLEDSDSPFEFQRSSPFIKKDRAHKEEKKIEDDDDYTYEEEIIEEDVEEPVVEETPKPKKQFTQPQIIIPMSVISRVKSSANKKRSSSPQPVSFQKTQKFIESEEVRIPVVQEKPKLSKQKPVAKQPAKISIDPVKLRQSTQTQSPKKTVKEPTPIDAKKIVQEQKPIPQKTVKEPTPIDARKIVQEQKPIPQKKAVEEQKKPVEQKKAVEEQKKQVEQKKAVEEKKPEVTTKPPPPIVEKTKKKKDRVTKNQRLAAAAERRSKSLGVGGEVQDVTFKPAENVHKIEQPEIEEPPFGQPEDFDDVPKKQTSTTSVFDVDEPAFGQPDSFDDWAADGFAEDDPYFGTHLQYKPPATTEKKQSKPSNARSTSPASRFNDDLDYLNTPIFTTEKEAKNYKNLHGEVKVYDESAANIGKTWGQIQSIAARPIELDDSPIQVKEEHVEEVPVKSIKRRAKSAGANVPEDVEFKPKNAKRMEQPEVEEPPFGQPESFDNPEPVVQKQTVQVNEWSESAFTEEDPFFDYNLQYKPKTTDTKQKTKKKSSYAKVGSSSEAFYEDDYEPKQKLLDFDLNEPVFSSEKEAKNYKNKHGEVKVYDESISNIGKSWGPVQQIKAKPIELDDSPITVKHAKKRARSVGASLISDVEFKPSQNKHKIEQPEIQEEVAKPKQKQKPKKDIHPSILDSEPSFALAESLSEWRADAFDDENDVYFNTTLQYKPPADAGKKQKTKKKSAYAAAQPSFDRLYEDEALQEKNKRDKAAATAVIDVADLDFINQPVFATEKEAKSYKMKHGEVKVYDESISNVGKFWGPVQNISARPIELDDTPIVVNNKPQFKKIERTKRAQSETPKVGFKPSKHSAYEPPEYIPDINSIEEEQKKEEEKLDTNEDMFWSSSRNMDSWDDVSNEFIDADDYYIGRRYTPTERTPNPASTRSKSVSKDYEGGPLTFTAPIRGNFVKSSFNDLMNEEMKSVKKPAAFKKQTRSKSVQIKRRRRDPTDAVPDADFKPHHMKRHIEAPTYDFAAERARLSAQREEEEEEKANETQNEEVTWDNIIEDPFNEEDMFYFGQQYIPKDDHVIEHSIKLGKKKQKKQRSKSESATKMLENLNQEERKPQQRTELIYANELLNETDYILKHANDLQKGNRMKRMENDIRVFDNSIAQVGSTWGPVKSMKPFKFEEPPEEYLAPTDTYVDTGDKAQFHQIKRKKRAQSVSVTAHFTPSAKKTTKYTEAPEYNDRFDFNDETPQDAIKYYDQDEAKNATPYVEGDFKLTEMSHKSNVIDFTEKKESGAKEMPAMTESEIDALINFDPSKPFQIPQKPIPSVQDNLDNWQEVDDLFDIALIGRTYHPVQDVNFDDVKLEDLETHEEITPKKQKRAKSVSARPQRGSIARSETAQPMRSTVNEKPLVVNKQQPEGIKPFKAPTLLPKEMPQYDSNEEIEVTWHVDPKRIIVPAESSDFYKIMAQEEKNSQNANARAMATYIEDLVEEEKPKKRMKIYGKKEKFVVQPEIEFNEPMAPTSEVRIAFKKRKRTKLPAYDQTVSFSPDTIDYEESMYPEYPYLEEDKAIFENEDKEDEQKKLQEKEKKKQEAQEKANRKTMLKSTFFQDIDEWALAKDTVFTEELPFGIYKETYVPSGRRSRNSSPSGRSPSPTRKLPPKFNGPSKQIYVDGVPLKAIPIRRGKQQVEQPNMPVVYNRPLGEEVQPEPKGVVVKAPVIKIGGKSGPLALPAKFLPPAVKIGGKKQIEEPETKQPLQRQKKEQISESAMYGALAGIINFVPEKNTEGPNVSVITPPVKKSEPAKLTVKKAPKVAELIVNQYNNEVEAAQKLIEAEKKKELIKSMNDHVIGAPSIPFDELMRQEEMAAAGEASEEKIELGWVQQPIAVKPTPAPVSPWANLQQYQEQKPQQTQQQRLPTKRRQQKEQPDEKLRFKPIRPMPIKREEPVTDTTTYTRPVPQITPSSFKQTFRPATLKYINEEGKLVVESTAKPPAPLAKPSLSIRRTKPGTTESELVVLQPQEEEQKPQEVAETTPEVIEETKPETAETPEDTTRPVEKQQIESQPAEPQPAEIKPVQESSYEEEWQMWNDGLRGEKKEIKKKSFVFDVKQWAKQDEVVAGERPEEKEIPEVKRDQVNTEEDAKIPNFWLDEATEEEKAIAVQEEKRREEEKAAIAAAMEERKREEERTALAALEEKKKAEEEAQLVINQEKMAEGDIQGPKPHEFEVSLPDDIKATVPKDDANYIPTFEELENANKEEVKPDSKPAVEAQPYEEIKSQAKKNEDIKPDENKKVEDIKLIAETKKLEEIKEDSKQVKKPDEAKPIEVRKPEESKKPEVVKPATEPKKVEDAKPAEVKKVDEVKPSTEIKEAAETKPVVELKDQKNPEETRQPIKPEQIVTKPEQEEIQAQEEEEEIFDEEEGYFFEEEEQHKEEEEKIDYVALMEKMRIEAQQRVIERKKQEEIERKQREEEEARRKAEEEEERRKNPEAFKKKQEEAQTSQTIERELTEEEKQELAKIERREEKRRKKEEERKKREEERKLAKQRKQEEKIRRKQQVQEERIRQLTEAKRREEEAQKRLLEEKLALEKARDREEIKLGRKMMEAVDNLVDRMFSIGMKKKEEEDAKIREQEMLEEAQRRELELQRQRRQAFIEQEAERRRREEEEKAQKKTKKQRLREEQEAREREEAERLRKEKEAEEKRLAEEEAKRQRMIAELQKKKELDEQQKKALEEYQRQSQERMKRFEEEKRREQDRMKQEEEKKAEEQRRLAEEQRKKLEQRQKEKEAELRYAEEARRKAEQIMKRIHENEDITVVQTIDEREAEMLRNKELAEQRHAAKEARKRAKLARQAGAESDDEEYTGPDTRELAKANAAKIEERIKAQTATATTTKKDKQQSPVKESSEPAKSETESEVEWSLEREMKILKSQRNPPKKVITIIDPTSEWTFQDLYNEEDKKNDKPTIANIIMEEQAMLNAANARKKLEVREEGEMKSDFDDISEDIFNSTIIHEKKFATKEELSLGRISAQPVKKVFLKDELKKKSKKPHTIPSLIQYEQRKPQLSKPNRDRIAVLVSLLSANVSSYANWDAFAETIYGRKREDLIVALATVTSRAMAENIADLYFSKF